MKTIYQLLSEVLATGLTQAQVADKIGVTQGTVSQIMIRKGKRELKFSAGVRLLDLHKSVMAKKQR